MLFYAFNNATNNTAISTLHPVMIATGAAVLLGGGTRSSGAYEFRADPARYQGAALEGVAGANAALAGKMAALR
mgnify:CR=1 FL=1